MKGPTRTIIIAEIGGTSVKIGFAHQGQVNAYARTYPTSRLRTPSPVEQLVAILREACAEAQLEPDSLVATVPGFIGPDQDTILSTANIPEFEGLKLASTLSSQLGIPVRLERDSVLQLLGEHTAGVAQGENEVLAIYFGTGIGAAYLVDGKVFRGSGWALEIGHMPIYRPDISPVPQSIEELASGKALSKLAERHKLGNDELFRDIERPETQAEISEFISNQAMAAACAITICSPRILILAGGVVELKHYPRSLLESRIRDCLPSIAGVFPPDIRWGELGWRAAIHGALAL